VFSIRKDLTRKNRIIRDILVQTLCEHDNVPLDVAFNEAFCELVKKGICDPDINSFNNRLDGVKEDLERTCKGGNVVFCAIANMAFRELQLHDLNSDFLLPSIEKRLIQTPWHMRSTLSTLMDRISLLVKVRRPQRLIDAISTRDETRFGQELPLAVAVDADLNEHAILTLLQYTDFDIRPVLRIRGVDVNHCHPLNFAIRKKRPRNVKLLLQAKADPNAFKDDYNFLVRAVTDYSSEIVKLLLAYKADVFVQTETGQNILDVLQEEREYLNAFEHEVLQPPIQTLSCFIHVDLGTIPLETKEQTYIPYAQQCQTLRAMVPIVATMKEKSIKRIEKYLKRAIPVEALALSILMYFKIK
jgi:hypothetical protein